MKELMWQYYFYLEAEGDIRSADGEAMMAELSGVCDKLKLVGSYEVR
jgi:chorismate mutase/prephenate dehydratase